MAIIQLDPEHNHTTECFKRHSKVFYSDTLVSDTGKSDLWFRRSTQLLVIYLVLLFLAFCLIPFQPVKATARVLPLPVEQAQLLPGFQTQLKALQVCPPNHLPVWADKTTLQCLKELP